jgi:purine-cytosine permease-like protein
VFQSAPASENTDSQYGDTSGLVAALNNLTVNGGWVINSGASAHVSSDNDTLSSTHVLSTPHYVTVSNGASMPVTIFGHAFLHTPSSYSFILNDVLRVPKLVCNLLSDHKFTRDNFCSIEFDLFSFSVKDL